MEARLPAGVMGHSFSNADGTARTILIWSHGGSPAAETRIAMRAGHAYSLSDRDGRETSLKRDGTWAIITPGESPVYLMEKRLP
jgi:hypothetical protein